MSFSALPLAITTTMSFVEVSPSTVIILKVRSTTSFRVFCNSFGSMATSVAINASMVAILGWIIPDPLAMPPMLISWPSSSNSRKPSLGKVSVVSMALAANEPALDLLLNLGADSMMPFTTSSVGNGSPIIPVEAIMIVF